MSLPLDTGLDLVRQLLAEDLHLAVAITTSRGSADHQVSVVNAAVIDHPLTGGPVAAFVAREGRKLVNLRHTGRITLVARAGWEWAAASGRVELSGPDDPDPQLGADRQRHLLRDIYHAAGGQHPDLDAYDHVMRSERRCAVLLTLERVWTNPPGSEHRAP